MNILMLGNGFDLFHKLPTTYLCFLKTMECLLSEDIIPIALGYVFMKQQKECKSIKESYEEYESFYNNYFFDEEDKTLLSNIKVKAYSNLWLNYFIKSYNKDIGWIDFEKEIAKVVNCFENLDIIDYVNNTKKYSTEDKFIIESFRFFCEFIPEKVQKIDNGSTQITRAHFKINDEYGLEYPVGSGKRIINNEKIVEKLFTELQELSEMLKVYLKVFVEKPLLKLKDEGIIETNNLFCHFDSVITFNYTNTYEILYNAPNIHFIHGKLAENIILGINPDKNDELEESSKADTSFIMFKKYYQRVLYRTDNGFVEMINDIRIKRNAINPQKNTLVVCGHSLDETDQDLIKEAFDVSDFIYVICHRLSSIGNYVANLIKIYGKTEFDRIRSEKQLKFVTYDEWRDEQLACAFDEGFNS